MADERDLLANLRLQLEIHNDRKLSEQEFTQVLNAINKGSIFERAKVLRDRVAYTRDNGERTTLELLKEKSQLFGFTGTPIMEPNAGTNEFGKRTTKILFGDVLHRYVITDAIRDENVLKFSVEYIRPFKRKECIVDYIIANHDKKTHNKKYTAIFCVSGVPQLIKYYRVFKERREAGVHDLKVATIFSYQAIELFSSLTAKDEIIMQPYEVYVCLFDEAFARMQEWAPTVDSVSELRDEEHELAFVKAFRELMRYRPALKNRKSVTERIATRITDFVETFVDGV